MKDLVIIGAGPAGITAAVYAARKKMDFSVVTKDIGGQAAWSGEIENYTGYQFISGPELAQKFREHLEKFEFELREGEEVVKVEAKENFFEVRTIKEEKLLAKAVIIASGKRPKMLGIPGEKEFKNRGVTYCATCDGPLFSEKVVVVVGGGNSALDATLQMMKIAKRVYLININPQLGGDPVMREKVEGSPKVEVWNNTQMVEITGDKFVRAVKVIKEGKSEELLVEGVFVEIGSIPSSEIIDFVRKNNYGEIIVNCAAETSVPGVFAAGDVTNVPEKQIIVAAGEGAKATLSAFKYLSRH